MKHAPKGMIVVVVRVISSCFNYYAFVNFKCIVDILGLLNFRAIKQITLISQKGHIKFKIKDAKHYFTPFFTLVYQNVQRKMKKSEHSKVSHFEKHGREEVLNFLVGINITLPKYSLMPKNCFILLFCT